MRFDATMDRLPDSRARELKCEGLRWLVREVDTTHVPGARAPSCLIFESEGVVRRAWRYPDDWRRLSDDRLWSCLDTPHISPAAAPSPGPATGGGGAPAANDAAIEVSSRARTLLDTVDLIRHRTHDLDDVRRAVLDQCRLQRHELQRAITVYAESLRREGMPPERVLVLVKEAMTDGLGVRVCDEPVAEDLMHEGIESCIAAYYAA